MSSTRHSNKINYNKLNCFFELNYNNDFKLTNTTTMNYNQFTSKITEQTKKATITVKYNTSSSTPPWFTDNLRKLINKKNYWFSKRRKNPNSSYFVNYAYKYQLRREEKLFK